jgi:integrase
MAENVEAQNTKRENGTGRIFRRKGSQFLWLQYYAATGEQVRVSSKTDSETKAKKKLRELIGKVAAGLAPDSRRIRYENLRDAYLSDCEINEIKSLRHDANGVAYLESVRRLDKFFAGERAADIDTDMLRNFRTKMRAQGLKNGSINRSLASLRRMFTLAQRDGKLRGMPFFPMLPEAKPRKDVLPQGQYATLLQGLPDYLRLPTSVGYHTGMRLGEIQSLTWTDNVNWIERYIWIEDSKSGDSSSGETAPRFIPFTDELEKLLREQHARRQACDRVCFRIDARGNVGPLGNFRKAWRSVCIKLGLGKMKPVLDSAGNPVFEKPRYATSKPKPKMVYSGLLFHGLRRTFVTDAENANVPRHEAMMLSGHKTENTYKRYAIGNLNRRRAAVATIDAYRAKQRDGNGDISGTAGASDKQQESVIN